MDIFMTSIERITSKKKRVFVIRKDLPECLHLKVWNETVANLTLMSLGVSTPEILLTLIEAVGNEFEATYIGPGTIVGSAAVNMLVLAFCIVSVSRGETRRIEYFHVFVVTGFFHLFSYVWLYVILEVCSPNVIELWEALATFAFFPLLVLSAYAANRNCWRTGVPSLRGLRGDESRKEFAEQSLRHEGSIKQEALVQFIREIRAYPGITMDDAITIAAAKLVQSEEHSAMWYRIGGARVLTSGRPITHKMNKRISQVRSILTEMDAMTGEGTPTEPVTPEVQDMARVEFESPSMAVTEATIDVPVHLRRFGNMDHAVAVRVVSLDGMATHGEDFQPVNEIVSFGPNQDRAQITVRLIDESKYEPIEEFYLRLSTFPQEAKVKVGKVHIMEIKIIPDESPGLVEFDKRRTIVKESSPFVEIDLTRKEGSDGEVSVEWKTEDDTAVSGVDYQGDRGTVHFRNGETKKSIKLKIINTMSEDKNVRFSVELSNPSGGAILGLGRKNTVIITDDDDASDILENIITVMHFNLDAFHDCRKTWCLQIKQAMLPNGGDVDSATNLDYFLHFLFFLWKVLFALIPPPRLLGGWLSFGGSLLCIALIAAVVGDLASVFGCTVGLHDTITAITLVSIGNSLTDAFACRFALRRSKFADNAIGNINGTAAITVFVGLGLTWSLAAIYHTVKGNQYIVPSSGIGIAVLLYIVVTTFTLILLVVRRNSKFFGMAEVGGPIPGRIISAVLLITAWLIFTSLSYIDIQGHFDIA